MFGFPECGKYTPFPESRVPQFGHGKTPKFERRIYTTSMVDGGFGAML